MQREELIQPADAQLIMAKAQYAKGESWGAQAWLVYPGKKVGVAIFVTDDPLAGLLFVLQKEPPPAYVMSAEMWQARMKPEEIANYQRGDTSKSPNRIEVFVQYWGDREGYHDGRTFTIDRINRKLDLDSAAGELKSPRIPETW